jgi:disulfide bond formation protein DsbB
MKRLTDRAGLWLAGMFVLSLGAVGVALVSQHMFGMEPCPWCVLQRLIYVAIAAACLLGLVWRSGVGRGVSGVLVLLLALCGGAAALWQHFVAAATESCNFTVAEKIIAALGLDGSMPDVFQARASCADAAVKVFGVPYEFYSLALFVLLSLGAVKAMHRRLRY